MKTHKDIAKALANSVRYSSGKGQYPEDSTEQKAYLDGVNTAIGMMYIDLTGTPKTKGVLESAYTPLIEEATRDKAELLEALVDMYDQYCAGGHSFMSAGEGAEVVLQKYGYDTDAAGAIIKRPN